MNYIAQAIKPLLALLIVLALHALVLWQVVQQQPRVVQPPKPIMISLITPPKPPPPAAVKALPVAPKKEPVAKPKPKRVKVKKVANSLKAIHQKVSATPQESATKGSTAARSSRGQRKNSGGVTKRASYKAAYLHNSYPPYPRISRRRGEEGKVLLRVKVTKTGRAATVQLKKSSGFKRLNKAAYQAVKKWRFVPARKNGKTVTGWVIVPIVFKLN